LWKAIKKGICQKDNPDLTKIIKTVNNENRNKLPVLYIILKMMNTKLSLQKLLLLDLTRYLVVDRYDYDIWQL